MKFSKHTFVVLLFSGWTLGLGWAIRGVFGHEYGAAWAGSMGSLAIVVATNRRDWLRRAPILAALGGIGWGVGGMMSYGLVIGYCRGTDFGNVSYGYTMLGVIGALYGFIGGGLFGLGLESDREKKAAWHSLLTEMFVCGYLVYVILVDFMDLHMTPPRSDNWARCLGASMAFAWFLHRGGFHRALRTAGYAALGAGIGFSFGNFIQTMTAVLELPVNGWNIMEFSLGFSGGVGMAYAVVTRDWPEANEPSRYVNWLSFLFFAALIPLANRRAAFSYEYYIESAERLGILDAEGFAAMQLNAATTILLIVTGTVIVFWWLYQNRKAFSTAVAIPILLLIHSLHYVSLATIKTNLFHTPFTLTNTRAWNLPALLAISLLWFALNRRESVLPLANSPGETGKRWTLIMMGAILMVIAITLISINTHGDSLPGIQERF